MGRELGGWGMAYAVLVLADREQSRVLTLGPGVGLQSHGREAGDIAQELLGLGLGLDIAAA